MAFNLFMSAISAAIGEAFVSLSADPLLVWNYGMLLLVLLPIFIPVITKENLTFCGHILHV